MSDDTVDIIGLHNQILTAFENDQNILTDLQERLLIVKNLLKKTDINHGTRLNVEESSFYLENLIKDIQTKTTEGFYVMESSAIIQRYKDILKIPKKVSFMGAVEYTDDGKYALINEYLIIARKYKSSICPSLQIVNKKCKLVKTDICKMCGSVCMVVEDGFLSCIICGAEEEIAANSSSYKDAERVNVGSKYTYDKRIHFRDCMNQYQGKQNSSIPVAVYEALEAEFNAHGLLVPSPDKEIRFSKIKREHILIFLKECSYSKHYEDAVLIHHHLTGVKPPDVSQLETSIINDFDKLVEAYERLYNNENETKDDVLPERRGGRKNFINNQYVLYQLLRKLNFPCDVSEFSILKTTERKSYHDDICRVLFKELGWQFTSVF